MLLHEFVVSILGKYENIRELKTGNFTTSLYEANDANQADGNEALGKK